VYLDPPMIQKQPWDLVWKKPSPRKHHSAPC